MNAGPIRSLIPDALRNLAIWPTCDEQVQFPGIELYRRRKEAVQMYSDDYPFEEIRKKTGIASREVQRLVKRCISADGAGRICGFRALYPGFRVAPYIRSSDLQNTQYSGRGGSSGSLTMLHSKYEDIASEVEERLLKLPSETTVHEARVPFKELHKTWLQLLRTKGLKDDDWPFNRKYKGYRSFVNYCLAIRENHLGRYITARSGKEAGRKHGIGLGYKALIPVLRPYSVVQLDFHKVDAASIILLKNEHGVELNVPVSRWHIGLLVETMKQAVLGVYISLETNPSADCVLETVQRALRPEVSDSTNLECILVGDGKYVINQLIPVLAWQGFAALKMDNAWSNTAVEVYNNIITTVGCAVNFGPAYMWWCRNLIESIFGRLTAHGLQRMPSTYGTGPADTRRSNPEGEAVKFRILLSTLIGIVKEEVRIHNEKPTEGLQWSSPITALQAALSLPKSGLFSQPLPRAVQQDMKLMMHMEIATVRGNIKKNVRPFVKVGRYPHTNLLLSSRYDLVGKKLAVYVDREKCRLVYATAMETAEYLGQLIPQGPWRNSNCSWRVRKLIQAAGLPMAYQSEEKSPVTFWGEQTKKKIVGRGTQKKKTETSKAALLLTKTILDSQEKGKPSPSELGVEMPSIASASSPENQPPGIDPFGLGTTPNISSRDQE